MTKRTKAKGFTLTELIICMGIMLLVVYMSMSPHIGDVTAKQEAERLNVWLARIIQQAIRMKRSFKISTWDMPEGYTRVIVEWGDNAEKEKFNANPACKITMGRNEIKYHSVSNGFEGSQCTITVMNKHKQGDKYYLIVSGTGRIRLSD